jgi:hypothetical protein
LVDTTSLLLGVSDECIETARAAAAGVVGAPDAARIEEYRALVGTGLACLETVLHAGRLQPRQEALVRLRYGTVLIDETENYAEAEVALSRGLAVCEKVSRKSAMTSFCSLKSPGLPRCVACASNIYSTASSISATALVTS